MLLLLFALTLSGCSSGTSKSAELTVPDVILNDPCTTSETRQMAGVIELGGSGYKAWYYNVDFGGRRRALAECDELRDEGWSTSMSMPQLVANTQNDAAKMKDICGDNVFIVASQGFQNLYDISLLETSKVPVVYLTGQQEAQYEWATLVDSDPDGLSISTGGGSLNIGGSRGGFSVPIGGVICEQNYTQDKVNTIVKSNPVQDWMRHRSYVSLTGGPNWILLSLIEGRKVNHEMGLSWSIQDIHKGLDILGNEDFYERHKELADIPSLGYSRHGLFLASLGTLKYLEELGINEIRLSPNETWAKTYVAREFVPEGFSM